MAILTIIINRYGQWKEVDVSTITTSLKIIINNIAIWIVANYTELCYTMEGAS